MKKLMVAFGLLGIYSVSNAQTNIFPSSGNAGIGTTNPATIVDIQSANTAPIITINSTATPNGSVEGGRLDLQLLGGPTKFGLNGDIPGSVWMIGQGNDAGYGAARIHSIITGGGNVGRNAHIADLVFSTKPSGSDGIAEALRIKGNGNIGIGTINPISKLVISDGGANGFEIDPVNGINGGSNLMAYNRSTSTYKTFNLIGSDFRFTTGSTGEVLRFTSSGDVGIGISAPPSGYKLAVNGKMLAKEIKVEATWADFVFDSSYKLPGLKETKQFIKLNGHLPGIPSAKEVEANGINLGEMNARLLQKIEELTLHLISQDEKLEAMQSEIKRLTRR